MSTSELLYRSALTVATENVGIAADLILKTSTKGDPPALPGWQ